MDVSELPFPGLGKTRERLLDVLSRLTFPRALKYLDIGPGLEEEARRNLTLRDAPAAPAHEVYTGVLYEHLGLGSLDAPNVLIASALWGFVRPSDRIPAYRLSMDADLPGLPLAATWRPVLGPALAAAAGPRGVVVDCRSGPYAAAAPIRGPLADRAVAVRVLREQDGARTVVSHLAKLTRGEVTRHLLELPADPRTPRALADAVGARWPVELHEPDRRGTPWTLDVVLPG